MLEPCCILEELPLIIYIMTYSLVVCNSCNLDQGAHIGMDLPVSCCWLATFRSGRACTSFAVHAWRKHAHQSKPHRIDLLQVLQVCRQWPRLLGAALTLQPPAWRSASRARPGAPSRWRGRCQTSRQCSVSWQSGGLCSS